MAESTDPASSGDAVGRRTFSTSFRGFDQAEVRAYLRVLAGEFSALRERVAELEAELRAAGEVPPPPPMTLDIATVTSALGEETARVLRAAQEAAEDLRTRAEDGAARTLKEAHEEAARALKEAQDEADRLRKEAQEEAERLQEGAEALVRERTAEADQKVAAATEAAAELNSAAERVLSERTAEAEASASAIREEAAEAAAQLRTEAAETSARVRREAEEVAARLRKDAETETAAAISKAVEEGRDMLGQARAARERVLSDLARRRKVAINQVELLRAGRESLQTSIEAARAESERILEDLKRSDEEARRATDQAARQTPRSPALGHPGGDGDDRDTESDGDGEDDTDEPAGAADSASVDGGAAGSAPGGDEASGGADQGSDVTEPASDAGSAPPPAGGDVAAADAPGSTDPAQAHTGDSQEGATGAGPVAPAPSAGPLGAEVVAPTASSPAPPAPPAGPTTGPTGPPVPTAASVTGSVDEPGSTTGPPVPSTAPPGEGKVGASSPGASSLGAATPGAAAPVVGHPDVDLTGMADVDLRVPPPGSSAAPRPEPAPPAAAAAPPAPSPVRQPYAHDPVPDAELPPAVTGAPAGRVDQLFAKIRADRSPKGADAPVRADGPARAGPDRPETGGVRLRPSTRSRSAPSRAEPATSPGAAEGPAGEPMEAMVVTGGASPEDPGLEAPRSDADESYLQRRDAVIEAALARAVRTAKRAFADDQNAALDRLRTLRVANRTVDAVMGEPSAQVEALARRVAPALVEGASAGARLGGGDAAAAVDPSLVAPVAERMAAALVEPFRRRLSDLFDDSEERGSVTVDRLNGVYREWRGRIEGAVGDAMTEAVSVGFGTAVAEGSPVRWVVDDVGGPCADCDDNALAGDCGFGSPFPTGQFAPPAHPGCRCVLARTAT